MVLRESSDAAENLQVRVREAGRSEEAGGPASDSGQKLSQSPLSCTKSCWILASRIMWNGTWKTRGNAASADWIEDGRRQETYGH